MHFSRRPCPFRPQESIRSSNTLRESGCILKVASGWLVSALFCLDLCLGGATRQEFLSDTVLQLASIPVLALVLILPVRYGVSRSAGAALALAGAIASLPLLQLIPLPPQIWSALPGRQSFVAAFRAEGLPLPWIPLSLSPATTLRSFFAVLPPVTIFVAAALLNGAARRTMTLVLSALACAGVALGLAQISGGAGSPLRFYSITNPQQAVGFFANRNHFSAFLYSAIPFLGAWAVWLTRERRADVLAGVAVCVAIYLVLMLGVGLSASRAGMLLAAVAGLGVLGLAFAGGGRGRGIGPGTIGIVASVVFATLFVALLGLNQIVQNLGPNGFHDARVEITRTTWRAAEAFAPFGTGFGDFVPVYQMFESPTAATSEYINRAHNDWLEVWLESGALGAAAAVMFLIWYVARFFKVWRNAEGENVGMRQLLARASTIVVALLALHSLVDYPLRTTAMACVFALACGCMVDSRGGSNAPLPRTMGRALV